MENNKIASAPTIERLENLINEFFYSQSYRISEMKVYNSKGLCDNIEIITKKGRFIAQFTSKTI